MVGEGKIALGTGYILKKMSRYEMVNHFRVQTRVPLRLYVCLPVGPKFSDHELRKVDQRSKPRSNLLCVAVNNESRPHAAVTP